MNIIERWWHGEHHHVVFALFVLAIALGGYLGLHWLYADDYANSPGARSAVRETVHLYQLGEDPETHLLRIEVEGVPLDLAAEERAGPLGAGKLTPVRGLLAKAKRDLDKYNAAVREFVAERKAQFERSPDREGYFDAPLHLFYRPDLAVSESGTPCDRVAPKQPCDRAREAGESHAPPPQSRPHSPSRSGAAGRIE